MLKRFNETINNTLNNTYIMAALTHVTICFSDKNEFKFTHKQLLLIPFFRSKELTDIVNIDRSSNGFEHVHGFATMDECCVDFPDKQYNIINQCDYFGYDKLKHAMKQQNNKNIIICIGDRKSEYNEFEFEPDEIKCIPIFKNKKLTPGTKFNVDLNSDYIDGMKAIHKYATSNEISLYNFSDIDYNSEYFAIYMACEYFGYDTFLTKITNKFVELGYTVLNINYCKQVGVYNL
jgi:hypothetical protein